MLKYLTLPEVQQLSFDWRYKGYSVLDMLTSEESDLISNRLDEIRIKRNASDEKYGEYDPYMHPHKESELAEKGAIAMALREEIREENGIEPGSTPTIGNSGERIVIKSPRVRQRSASSFEGGGGGGDYLNEIPPEIATGLNATASSSAPPSVSSIRKTLSFGHLEIKKIVNITEADHHKGEGHHSPTVFDGFCKSEAKMIKIESLSPSPASSPMPVMSSPKPSKDD